MNASSAILPRPVQVVIKALLTFGAAAAACAAMAGTTSGPHDVIIRGGLIYDGSGKPPYVGDVAIDNDRIS